MRDLRDIVRSADAVDLLRHELNAPVATALLYVSIAENYASRLPVDVITPALRVVRSEIQRLKSLIDTMTELQRSGRPSLRPQLIDIGATVRATVKRLLTTFSGTESVAITVPPHAVHGWWDQTAVEQIVSNLLSNALKFGQGRSIRLVVKATAAGASISVRDQGVGIAAVDRIRIFERHEHAPAEEGGGNGLGLWLVRELTLAHGGRVTVQSRKGRGTTFTVVLRTQPPLLAGEKQFVDRLPPQRSPMRTVSHKAARGAIPAYWQDRLARSQLKVALLPRNESEAAPISTMMSPSLTANLKAKWPSRTRKSNEVSVVRSAVPRRPSNRSRNFASPTLRGSGP
jgi:anti-sigma regulatory factor (Ser/Thr protein kinase)